jgi:hypothetical protein
MFPYPRSLPPFPRTFSAPDHVKVFLNDILKLSAATDGYQLAIRSDREFSGTILAANLVSVCVSDFNGVHSLGDILSLGPNAASLLKLAVDLSAFKVSALSRRVGSARFRGKVIALDFVHLVSESAPPSVLKLPVD